MLDVGFFLRIDDTIHVKVKRCHEYHWWLIVAQYFYLPAQLIVDDLCVMIFVFLCCSCESLPLGNANDGHIPTYQLNPKLVWKSMNDYVPV